MIEQINPLSYIDFYKADHRRQYPEGTTLVYANFTPRMTRMTGVDKVVVFGLQDKWHLATVGTLVYHFQDVVTKLCAERS